MEEQRAAARDRGAATAHRRRIGPRSRRCALLPLTAGRGLASASLACPGNRSYTELGGGAPWIALPGRALGILTRELEAIVEANEVLVERHGARQWAALAPLSPQVGGGR
jgi:hypothetical protein